MAIAPSPTAPQERILRPYRALNHSVERAVGVDTRLLYGFAVPVLAVVGMIIAFAVTAEAWMIPAIIFFIVVGIAVVWYGLVDMLGEDDDQDLRAESSR